MKVSQAMDVVSKWNIPDVVAWTMGKENGLFGLWKDESFSFGWGLAGLQAVWGRYDARFRAGFCQARTVSLELVKLIRLFGCVCPSRSSYWTSWYSTLKQEGRESIQSDRDTDVIKLEHWCYCMDSNDSEFSYGDPDRTESPRLSSCLVADCYDRHRLECLFRHLNAGPWHNCEIVWRIARDICRTARCFM